MQHFSRKQRLAVTGVACSAVVAFAGIVALQGGIGIVVASVLLTAAVILGLVGGAYADNNRLGVGIVALIAAAFPLFLGLYVIGMNILRRLGAGVAGGLLIGLSAGLALASAVLWLHAQRSERSPQRS